MPRCSVIGCGTRQRKNHPNLSFHILPKSHHKRKLWLEAIGSENIRCTTKNIYICSLHFDQSCYNFTMNVNKLKDDAVPSRTLLPTTIETRSSEILTEINQSRSTPKTLDAPLAVKSQHASNRAYCSTCQELYIITQSKKHSKDHRVITPLTDEQLARPSSWLPALENDDVEAQYLFTKKSVSTVLGILRNNNIKNILCLGTPSVHEAAQLSPEFESLLLDYDNRHHQFNNPGKYIWYNMFNNFMFNGNDDEKLLKKFLRKSKEGGLCIVMDPPFAGRVEPLVQTIRELSSTYRRLCEKPETEVVPVLWAFPYFAEPYISNLMPEIKMHDYQIEYENHKKFHNKSSGRKFGSPVRFFTNLPFATIDLSNDSNYKKCDKCNFWVSAKNNHCNKCKECTSKNGMTYRHCNVCRRCVKPTFFHCKTCERCCQEKGHVCGVVVESQSCFNCREKGHKRSNCPQLQQSGSAKKKRIHA